MNLHAISLAIAGTYGLSRPPRTYAVWVNHFLMAGGVLHTLERHHA